MLEKIDLGKRLDKSDYKERFKTLQRRLYDLQKACWDAGIPSIILFEGWDAAGPGRGGDFRRRYPHQDVDRDVHRADERQPQWLEGDDDGQGTGEGLNGRYERIAGVYVR